MSMLADPDANPDGHAVALMQPYFLPYLGYWQLLARADEFIVYDTAQYVRGSWINRNRIRLRDQVRWLTLPVEHAPHRWPINRRRLAPDTGWRRRLVDQAAAAYRAAPHREAGLALLTEILGHRGRDLAPFLVGALRAVAARLAIDTPIRLASALPVDPGVDREQRVIAVCRARGATDYLNLSGGRALYAPEAFRAAGLTLRFRVPPGPPPDRETHDDHALSVLDLIMRRDPTQVAALLADSAWAAPAGPADPLSTRSRR